MDLDETSQVGLRPEKTKPCMFPVKSRYGFRREREKMGRRGVVFCRVYDAPLLPLSWIDFRQTSHEHVSTVQVVARDSDTHGFIFQKERHICGCPLGDGKSVGVGEIGYPKKRVFRQIRSFMCLS